MLEVMPNANDVEVENTWLIMFPLLLPTGEMILDSLPMVSEHDATQLPCSPTSLFNSDVASKTLGSLELAEQVAFTAAAPNNVQPQVGAHGHPQKR